jgi:hydrogenase maturation protein HypF
MAEFSPCSECLSEYSSPENRRFHSQTIACPNCGPQLNLLDKHGNIVESQEQALSKTILFLKQGKIIAIKGVGGFQLIVDATNSRAVRELRIRKQRSEKPFALMVECLERAKELCQINITEQQALISHVSPIVLLKSLNSLLVADVVAPRNSSLGIMLPASPLHHLLAHDFGKPLITTSGNLMNEPICITDQQALDRLGNIADFFLTHNRPIIRALDDSIVRSINNKTVVMRRARGYVPSSVKISTSLPNTLALGGQMKNTVAISQGNHLILSQHIGDLNSTISQQQFQQTISDLQRFYSTTPTSVIHDLHPDYHSSIFASQQEKKQVAVQHHHAHILSCMAEHDLQAPVLGFAWDGNGIGTDNTSWGGECFLLTGKKFTRLAYLRPFPLVGGDKVAFEPRRSALGLLYEMNSDQLLDNNKLDFLSTFTQQEIKLLQQSLTKQLNCPYTSSIGRLFDAVSSLLGLCHINQFEGQAAMQLEQLASTIHTNESYPYNLIEEDCIIIDWYSTITALLTELNVQNKSLIAAKFHNTLAEITARIAELGQQKNIVLSGGCFQNAYLTERCIEKLKIAGFSVYTHKNIPPNDGGLALGQLYSTVL